MLLIKNAEINGYRGMPETVDIRLDKNILEIGKDLSTNDEEVLDANGGALLPGLHDHHIHLLALAAKEASIHCGPPEVNNTQELKNVLNNATVQDDGWIRAIGYHQSVAGDLDRWALDNIVKDKPLRLQHRSGILWTLNSCAIELLQLEKETHIEGLEKNEQREITGRLFRLDKWLREKIQAHKPKTFPNIEKISKQLASYGVTGITDTTPSNDNDVLRYFERAIDDKKFLQKLFLMGNENLQESTHPMIKRGHLKILLDEYNLPNIDELKKRIQNSHQQKRPVAFHCVTHTELVFALALLKEIGSLEGDRIEHASIIQQDIFPLLKSTGVTVVTQPNFIAERGDQYQQDIETKTHADLYRCKSLLDKKIPLGGSTDAPYGNPDPGLANNYATERTSPSAYCFNEKEKLTAEQALMLFLSKPENAGGETRTISEGEPANLCLLNTPWQQARQQLNSCLVAYTIFAGEITFKERHTVILR